MQSYMVVAITSIIAW